MPELSKESVALFGYLLPGFLAAWVLYGLTSDPKPSQFERVVQALIFTFVVHALLSPLQSLLTFVGEHAAVLRPWDDTSRDIARLVLALLLGLILAIYTNTDAVHRWFRDRGLTTRD
jgi:fructose-specific phosphotransferase system IIC component